MSFDGSNTAYCVEPLKKTPSSGSYSYDLLSQNSPLRKALYYLNGGYGYDKVVKDKYFSGWSDDNSYVIGHLVVAYIYAGNSADTGAFHGAPQSYIDKALEVASAIQGLPNPPEGFRAFIVPGQGSQTIAGSWYQVPNGWIELKKSSANGSVSDGNPNYSLKGAVYGIYQGEKLIQKLTTDENGYARSGELEEGDYTIKELSASKGYMSKKDVAIEPETNVEVVNPDNNQNDTSGMPDIRNVSDVNTARMDEDITAVTGKSEFMESEEKVSVDKAGWIVRRISELGGYENISDSVKADIFGFDIADVSGSIWLFSDVMKRLGIKLDGDEMYEEFQRIYDESVGRDAGKDKAEDKMWNRGRGR